MRRAVLATSLLAACSFRPGTLGDTADAAMPPPDSGGDGSTLVAHCHVANSAGLELCLDFDDSNLAHDGAVPEHDALVTNTSTMSRSGQHAMSLTSSSSIMVPAASSFELGSELTIEMFIKTSSSAPDGQWIFPLTNNNNYALAIDDQGDIACFIGNVMIPSSHQIDDDAWHYVACTYNSLGLSIYVGAHSECFPTGTITGGPITGPILVGSGFVGGIDDVHVYSRALPAPEACQNAGGSCLLGCQ